MRKSERRQVREFIEECSNTNLLVNLDNLGGQGKHSIESMEQASNGKLTIHAWNWGASPKHDFSLLDINTPIFIVRNLDF